MARKDVIKQDELNKAVQLAVMKTLSKNKRLAKLPAKYGIHKHDGTVGLIYRMRDLKGIEFSELHDFSKQVVANLDVKQTLIPSATLRDRWIINGIILRERWLNDLQASADFHELKDITAELRR